MRWILSLFLVVVSSQAWSLDLTKEELDAIVKAAPSDDAIPQLAIYPACNRAVFTITSVLPDGTASTQEMVAKQWYVDRKYAVGQLTDPKNQGGYFVRSYDEQTRLYYGWNVYPNGNVLVQVGMYDPELEIMAWTTDQILQGKRFHMRSIQSFKDKAKSSWKTKVYVDGVLSLEMKATCEYQQFDQRR